MEQFSVDLVCPSLPSASHVDLRIGVLPIIGLFCGPIYPSLGPSCANPTLSNQDSLRKSEDGRATNRAVAYHCWSGEGALNAPRLAPLDARPIPFLIFQCRPQRDSSPPPCLPAKFRSHPKRDFPAPLMASAFQKRSSLLFGRAASSLCSKASLHSCKSRCLIGRT